MDIDSAINLFANFLRDVLKLYTQDIWPYLAATCVLALMMLAWLSFILLLFFLKAIFKIASLYRCYVSNTLRSGLLIPAIVLVAVFVIALACYGKDTADTFYVDAIARIHYQDDGSVVLVFPGKQVLPIPQEKMTYGLRTFKSELKDRQVIFVFRNHAVKTDDGTIKKFLSYRLLSPDPIIQVLLDTDPCDVASCSSS